VSHTYKDSISLVTERLYFLTDTQRADILGKTAERLLFRKPA